MSSQAINELQIILEFHLCGKKIFQQHQVSTLGNQFKEKLVVESYFKCPWAKLPLLIISDRTCIPF